MNLLFFLTPKQDVLYIYEDFTLRQTLEKWSNQRYATIPVLKRNGADFQLPPPPRLQGRYRDHRHADAFKGSHRTELCAGGG